MKGAISKPKVSTFWFIRTVIRVFSVTRRQPVWRLYSEVYVLPQAVAYD